MTGRIGGGVNEQMDGWIAGHTDGWMTEWMDDASR